MALKQKEQSDYFREIGKKRSALKKPRTQTFESIPNYNGYTMDIIYHRTPKALILLNAV
jgi:hypothetical protein